ncbi:MAG TPA: hypothetical protein GXX75_26065 [Clostridiales bacterium]|nr:hypothetical protein [Clostridiales bacterium]
MEVKVLDALMIALPLVKKIFGLDTQICLCDREKTIGVWYGDTFRMDVKVGDPLDIKKPGTDMMLKAMETGIGNSGILPEFVYGVAVDGIITPIFEDGKVVGVVSAAVSIKGRIEIENAAGNLNNNLTNSQNITNEIAESASDLAEKLEKARSFSQKIEELVADTSSLVKGIEANSHKTKILAVNASIEAARAGSEGKGFSIVANEMGKLAKVSGESTKLIGNSLYDMFGKLKDINTEINSAAVISTTQAAAMEEMAASLEEITQDASKLEQIAKIKRR